MKRFLCTLLILAMLCSGMQGTIVLASEQTQEKQYVGNGFEVLFAIDNTWDDGYNATVSITNTGEKKIENWYLFFQLSNKITNIWNAVIVSSKDGQYSIKNTEWNQDIPVGATVSFGFTAEGSFESRPSEYILQSSISLVDNKQYQITYSVMNHWSNEFTGSITITNVSDSLIEDWKLMFSFDNKISQIWNADILKQKNGEYTIDNDNHNSNILPQQSVTLGFLCEQGDSTKQPEQFVLQEYKADGKTSETENSETVDSDIEDFGIEDLDADEYDETFNNETLTEDNADQYVHIELQPGNTERCVLDDIILVNDAEDKYDVTWISSDTKVISNTGKVSRPEKNQSIVMTAVIKGDGQSIELPFTLDVKAKSQINVSEIEDYSVEDLKELNQDDEDFETIVNDFGYLQEVYGNYSDFKVDSYESALYALYHVKSAIGITDPFAELVPYRTFVDDTGYTFQFAQTIQGITTFDNIVTVASNAQGETDYLKSGYYPVKDTISTIPQISYQEAEEILEKQYGTITVKEENKNNICVVNYYGHVDLAWNIQCQLESQREDYPSGSYRFLVGAADGEVKFHSELSNHATSIKRVKTSGKDLEGIKQSFFVAKETKKTFFSTKTRYLLQDPLFHITVGTGVPSPHNSDKMETKKEVIAKKKNDWKPVEVSALHNMKKVLSFYHSNFKRVSYANNNHKDKKYTYYYKTKLGQGVKTNIYLAEDLKNNALWDRESNKMYLGMGDGKQRYCVDKSGNKAILKKDTELKKISFALCRDILCHEYTHGIMDNDTNLGECSGIPGAINEAYADIAACFMDGNWTFGEKIGKKKPMRDITDPTSCYTASKVGGDYYIDPKVKDPYDKGGSHANSTVISHAVYRMEQKGIATSDLKDIWYNTIRSGLDSKTNFYTIRKQFLTSCKRQNYSNFKTERYKEKINESFNETNVTKASSDHSYKQYAKLQDRNYYCSAYFQNSLIFQGKVVESDKDVVVGNNKVLSGVTVSIKDLDGNEIGKQTVTDQKGRYRIKSNLGQAYEITFQKEGYQEETMYLSDINELIQQEYYCDTIELVLKKNNRTGGAVGTIYNASTMRHVSGIELLLRKGMNNTYTRIIDKTKTDDNGEYYLRNLEAGIYCLEVLETKDYESTFFNIKIVSGMVLGLQDGYISSVLDSGQMRTVLTWGDAPEDLDAHMLCELSDGSKEDVGHYYKKFNYKGNKICALDVDDRNGYGPETITLYDGKTGEYRYYVHQYSSDGILESSNASVHVYLPGRSYPSYTFHVPEGQGDYWDVFRYNSATQRMIPVNKIGNNI